MSWEPQARGRLSPLFGATGTDTVKIQPDTLDELSHGLGMLYEIDLLRQIGPKSNKSREKAARNCRKVLAAKWGDGAYIPISAEAKAELQRYADLYPPGVNDPSTDPAALDRWENKILFNTFRLLLDNPEVTFREKPGRKITKRVIQGVLSRALGCLSVPVCYDDNIILRPGFADNSDDGDTVRKRMERAFGKAWHEINGWGDRPAKKAG